MLSSRHFGVHASPGQREAQDYRADDDNDLTIATMILYSSKIASSRQRFLELTEKLRILNLFSKLQPLDEVPLLICCRLDTR